MQSITSGQTEAPAEKLTLWQLPKLVWACGALFSVNLLIAGAIAISPELRVDMYGEAVDPASEFALAGARPSPFVEPASLKPRPVRTAERLRPIVEIDPEVQAAVMMELPARTVTAALPVRAANVAYVSGEKVHDVVEKQSDYPRLTASVVVEKRATPAELPMRRATLN